MYFVKRKHEIYYTKCLFIGFSLHGLNYEVDFSINECFKSKPNHIVNVLTAMRLAINDQIRDYKNQFISNNEIIKSELSDKLMLEENINVDHEKPFSHLINDFFILNNVNEIELKEFKGTYQLANIDLLNKWKQYHKINAKLRCVTQQENKTLAIQIESLNNWKDKIKIKY
ncbi:MAG: hypothetical protein ACOCV1_04615 [Bacillota bacterium]